MTHNRSIPVTAATYYAVYASMVGFLAPDREKGVVADGDINKVISLAWSLARTHMLLDAHRIPHRAYSVASAISRAENLTDGSMNALKEQETLEHTLATLLVDAALVLKAANTPPAA